MAARVVFSAVFLLACQVASARAQQAGVALQIESRSLEVGEAVDVQLVCTNTGQPELPVISTTDGLQVAVTNQTPFVSQTITSVNGRRSQTSTHTFPLRVVATKEGNHALGPIRVKAGGKEYQTEPVTISVRKAQPVGTKGDRYLFVEIDAKPRKLYVTQSVQANLTIGIRKVVIEGREYPMDSMLRYILDQDHSDFSVFAGGTGRDSILTLTDSTGADHDYVLIRVSKNIMADQIGFLNIGPVLIQAQYPTAIRPNIFGRVEITKSRKEFARADGIEIEVIGPPVEGRPASFTGAIGSFDMQVSARPDRVRQGEPVTLTIRIGGAPLEGLAGPNLSRFTDLAGRFDFTPDDLVGDMEGGGKVFRKAIFPKRAGEQTLPPIEWAYFDPKTERYAVLSSEAIPITVDPGTTPSELISLAPTDPREPASPRLKVLSGGIQPNVVDVSVLASSRTELPTVAGVAMTLILPPIAFAGCHVLARRHRRMAGDKGFVRRTRAFRRAENAVRRAGQLANPQEAVVALAASVSDYLCDRFGHERGTLTPADAESLLRVLGVADEIAASVRGFLERADAVRFAPIGVAEGRWESDRQDALTWIRSIETAAGQRRVVSS